MKLKVEKVPEGGVPGHWVTTIMGTRVHARAGATAGLHPSQNRWDVSPGVGALGDNARPGHDGEQALYFNLALRVRATIIRL